MPVLGTDPDIGAPLDGTEKVTLDGGVTCTTQSVADLAVSTAYTGTAGSITLTGSAFSIDVTYIGQASITTLGTITTGTWNATAITAVKGGTGQIVYTVGDVLYASSTTVLSKLGIGTAGQVLKVVAGIPAWGTGGGDVIGPASAVDLNIAVFDGVTGKLIKDGGSTIAALRTPSIQAVTSSATVTPTFADDMVKITAQAAALSLANPTGTAIAGLGLVIRIKDNGTARAITYGTQYRAIGITLPTTTVISKTTYIAMIYNSDDTKWDCVATGTEA